MIVFRIIQEGKMDLTYEQKEAMIFIGYHTLIRPEEGYVKCPEGVQRKICQAVADNEARDAG